MSFIGNSFTNQSFVPQVDYFNGDASTTAFTLSRSVGSVYDIQAVIENVPQNPASAFTVSGNVITFTSAPPSGTNNIYVRYTSPTTQLIKPAQGTVGPTEINSSYSLWNLSGATINYTAGSVGIGNATPSSFAGALNLAVGTGSSGSAVTLYTGTSSTGAVYFADGSTSSDRYRGAVEYTHTDDAMLFTTAASERMRITSTGNVGIGTDAPSAVTGFTTNRKVLQLTGGGWAQIRLGGSSGTMIDHDDDALTVTTIRNLYSNNGAKMQFQSGYITLGTGTSYTERMRVLADGAIAFGTTEFTGATGISMSNASDSASYGKSMYFNSPYNGTRNAISFGYNSTGVGAIVTGTSTTSYNTSSDYRLKENISPMTGALSKVAQLKPVTYNWKLDGANGDGFIAHELQEVCPLAVHGEKDAVGEDGKIIPQSIDPSKLIATLTAAIQEQQSIIEELKSRIEVLEAK